MGNFREAGRSSQKECLAKRNFQPEGRPSQKENPAKRNFKPNVEESFGDEFVTKFGDH